MYKRIKKLWLNALLSGEYVQGRDKLLTIENNGEHSFCCLGVLCDLHSRETGTKWEPGIRSGVYFGYTGSLPSRVMEWAGISSIDNKDSMCHLVNMNDHEKKNFKQIASYIEKEL